MISNIKQHDRVPLEFNLDGKQMNSFTNFYDSYAFSDSWIILNIVFKLVTKKILNVKFKDGIIPRQGKEEQWEEEKNQT